MPFNRSIQTGPLAEGSRLTADMVGIGMLFSATASADPNIEDTLIAASVEGMERDDLRVLAVLTTWIEIHHPRVNADRLVRALEGHSSPRVRCYWAAVGSWLAKDRRFARLAALHQAPRINLLRVGAEYQLHRRGEDPRFRDTGLRVPAGTLRDRHADVLPPVQLAKQHAAYRLRILIGPTYRADMWAALDRDPRMSAAALARAAYGSFATAWRVRQDWALLHPERV